ncbi:MAG: hypothetical protein ACJASR_002618 [Psychroserpens sp.]|jgi:hypothetical protein
MGSRIEKVYWKWKDSDCLEIKIGENIEKKVLSGEKDTSTVYRMINSCTWERKILT